MNFYLHKLLYPNNSRRMVYNWNTWQFDTINKQIQVKAFVDWIRHNIVTQSKTHGIHTLTLVCLVTLSYLYILTNAAIFQCIIIRLCLAHKIRHSKPTHSHTHTHILRFIRIQSVCRCSISPCWCRFCSHMKLFG